MGMHLPHVFADEIPSCTIVEVEPSTDSKTTASFFRWVLRWVLSLRTGDDRGPVSGPGIRAVV
jgi:hypothetical protein